MKKNRVVIVSSIFIGIIVIMLHVIFFNNEEFIINTSDNIKLLNKYDNMLDDIYNNMEYVSISNDEVNKNISWTSYKLDMNDSVQEVYDALVRDVRYCYVYFIDDGSTYTNSNYLGKFRNLDKVSRKHFKSLTKLYSDYNKICLDNFDKYNDLLMKENDEIKALALVLRPILDYKSVYNMEVDNYEELLKNEYYKVSLIRNISDFLKLKYDDII